jgi:SAM-dependent methyltransferase
MLTENVQKVLDRIKLNDLVLDVGGWACPFNRANWVIDAESYETRGFYEKIGLPKYQGGEKEYFSKETWIQRDICDKKPWPFKDKFFDFSICSHTLEDIRDPLYVCSEIIRVSKAGYLEVPSRVWESCRGIENYNIAGLSHHRWLVEISNNNVEFTMKYHNIHSSYTLSFPVSFSKKVSGIEKVSFLFWEDSFNFSEKSIQGIEQIYKELENFVSIRYKYPVYIRASEEIRKKLQENLNKIRRKLNF